MSAPAGGRLAGKHAFVTAAGAGIGRATALAFAAEGAAVVAADVDAAALATLEGVKTLVLDVRDAAAVSAAAAAYPATEVLFLAAGVVANGSILDCGEDDWARSMELNVTSTYRAIRAFLPAMAARRKGSIIAVASVASSLKGVPNRFAYGASKAAVIGITKSVAADFVGLGVRCNAICPGTVDTPSLQGRMAATGDLDAARAAFIARQPMGRLGAAEEIAALAVYLAGDESAFTTGQTHVIDGGWLM